MKQEKTVAVIVLNYNGLVHLQEYFQSLYAQTIIPDEILMMDNGSNDGSVEFVRRYFPHVTIIEYRKKNIGTAGSSNYAFQFIHSKYVIFQSNDIKLDKNCIRGLLNAIQTFPNAGMVTSLLVKYQKNPKTKQYHLDNAGGIMDRYGFGMQKYPDALLSKIPSNGETFFSYGGSFITRADIFKKIGGYDDKYFTLNDDIDLSWRMRLEGYRVYFTKQSIVYHKVSATLGILYDRPKKRYWSERNMFRTILKNYRIRDFFTRFPIYLILTFGQIAYLIFRKRIDLAWPNIQAFIWNIIYFPDTVRLRSKIPHDRQYTVEPLLEQKSLKLQLFSAFKHAI